MENVYAYRKSGVASPTTVTLEPDTLRFAKGVMPLNDIVSIQFVDLGDAGMEAVIKSRQSRLKLTSIADSQKGRVLKPLLQPEKFIAFVELLARRAAPCELRYGSTILYVLSVLLVLAGAGLGLFGIVSVIHGDISLMQFLSKIWLIFLLLPMFVVLAKNGKKKNLPLDAFLRLTQKSLRAACPDSAKTTP